MRLTPEERIRKKIADLKKALAADKQHWGGYYHDGRGLRYLQPVLYLKLHHYQGAMRYFRWFDKNFPDDCCFPIFLAEWTITLFKTGKKAKAEKKALQTFMANIYLWDKFLGKELLHFDINESSEWESEMGTENLVYSKDHDEYKDFAQWLDQFMKSEKFMKIANEFIKIETQLKTEPTGRKRSQLVKRRYGLQDNY
jgi:hypothetical protein